MIEPWALRTGTARMRTGTSCPALWCRKPTASDRMRRFDRVGERTILVAEFAAWTITVQQVFADAGMADHFVT